MDYHGYSAHSAWKDFNKRIIDLYFSGVKSTIIITGNGRMGHEIPTWCAQHKYVNSCHPLNRDNGKWLIKIKSNKVKSKKIKTNIIDYYKDFNGIHN